MKVFRHFLLILVVFSLFNLNYAQENRTQTLPKSKEKLELETKAFELLSEVIDETATLKLAENRSYISSLAATLFWEKDEKLARQLFHSAANELIKSQNTPKSRRQTNIENTDYYRNLIFNNLRGQLVFRILPKDAELASEILYTTRPSELANAVQTYEQIIAQTGKKPDLSNYKQEERMKLEAAITEIQHEQQIKKEIAKKDPQKLAENIRESFAKEMTSYGFLDDLEILNKKDHALAQKVLSEIMQNLASADFSNYSKSYVAYWLYRRFLAVRNKPVNQNSSEKNKQLELDEKSIKAIANKEFDYLLTKTLIESDSGFVERVIYLKQILPERFPEIKGKYEKAKGVLKEWADDAETTEKLGENPTLKQIVENSSKLGTNSKTEYYKKAVGKLFETESQEKIAQMLNQIPEEKDRENALDYLNSLAAEKKAIQESPTEAKQAVLQIKSDKERIAKLIDLAISYHQRKTAKSQKIAEDLMDEAGKLVNETPETYTEFTALLPVIAGYASVNPKKAVDLISPLVGKSNELIDAYVLLANYDDARYPYVSENEILLGGQDGYYFYKGRYGEIVKKLTENDFDKSKNVIENFKRADVRILAKLILIESILVQ